MASGEPLLATAEADGAVQENPARDYPEEAPFRCSRKVVLGLALLISFTTGAMYVVFAYRHNVALLWQPFLRWCQSLGWKAGLVITLGTWVFTSLGLPASGFFGGAAAIFATLYGTTRGAVIAIVSCGLGFWAGCVSAFVLARHFLKPLVASRLEKVEAMRVVNIIIEEEGWKFAFLVRLSPFLPVEVFNFACGLSSMSFSQNAIACFGSLPTASFEIWMYAQVANAAMTSQQGGMDSTRFLIMLAVNVPIVTLLVLVVRKAHRKYHEKVDMKANLHQQAEIYGHEAASLPDQAAQEFHQRTGL